MSQPPSGRGPWPVPGWAAGQARARLCLPAQLRSPRRWAPETRGKAVTQDCRDAAWPWLTGLQRLQAATPGPPPHLSAATAPDCP